MQITKIFRTLRRLVDTNPDPVLLHAQARLEQLLTDKRRAFLHSLMMIDSLPVNVDPLTGSKPAPYRSVTEVLERTQLEFGPNHNLVKAIVKLFKHDPAELIQIADRLENAFCAMETRGFSPRKIIPVLYIWVIDESFSQIPKNIYQIHELIDKIGQIMDEGLDPVKVLWHDALVGKGISFNG